MRERGHSTGQTIQQPKLGSEAAATLILTPWSTFTGIAASGGLSPWGQIFFARLFRLAEFVPSYEPTATFRLGTKKHRANRRKCCPMRTSVGVE
jgi:hypothetical protein